MCRGFGFVRFTDRRDAEEAMQGMEGAMIDGREIHVMRPGTAVGRRLPTAEVMAVTNVAGLRTWRGRLRTCRGGYDRDRRGGYERERGDYGHDRRGGLREHERGCERERGGYGRDRRGGYERERGGYERERDYERGRDRDYDRKRYDHDMDRRAPDRRDRS